MEAERRRTNRSWYYFHENLISENVNDIGNDLQMSYPVDHHQHPSPDSQYHQQGVNVHHQFDRHHPQYYGSDLGNLASAGNYHQYRLGPGPMNELDNFSNLSTLRHPNDPYYDTKVMKQKLLSQNVPESCV